MLARLYRLHRWLGLGCGIILIALSVSGSALMFRRPTEATFAPTFWNTPRHDYRGSLDALVAAVRARCPDWPIQRYAFPRTPDTAGYFHLDGGDGRIMQVSIDPASARILAVRERGERPEEWLMAMHHYLYLGPWGRPISGLFGLVMTVLSLSGYILHRRFTRAPFAPGIGADRGSVKPPSDLHRRFGQLSLVFLLVLGLSGAWVGLEDVPDLWSAKKPRDAAATREAAQKQRKAPAKSLDAMAAAHPDWFGTDAPALAEAQLQFPRKAGDLFSLTGMHSGEFFWRRSRLAWVPETGEIKQRQRAAEMPWSTRFVAAMYSLHYGDFGGMPLRWIYAFGGLLPVGLAITGWMVWRRKQRLSTRV